MSDTSQGPGWWQAADGKWYAPEQHPNYQLAAAPQPAAAPPAAAPQAQAPTPPGPMAPPPQFGAPPGAPVGAAPGAYQAGYTTVPVQKSSSKGCVIALVVVFALALLLTVGIFLLVRKAGDVATNAIGINNCPFLTQADAEAALGGTQVVSDQNSFAGGFAGAIDSRVLPSAPACTSSGTSAGTSETARVAKYDGSDASTMYQNELTKAKGAPDSSGAVTVTGDDYYLKDVSLGDEAFCTKEAIGASSGVLARKGNTLVYVSIIDSSSAGTTADETNCTNAQKLATKVLG